MSTDTLLAVVTIVVLVVLLIGVFLLTNRPRRRSRRLRRDSEGNVVALGRTLVGEPFVLEGKGTTTSSAMRFDASHYVLSYELDVPSRVSLIAQTDGDEETILISSGAGLKEFEVAAPGQYLCKVEPTNANSPWKLNFRPVKRR